VYDAGNRKSFENLERWLDEMKQEIGNSREIDNMVICVCANKVILLNVGCVYWHVAVLQCNRKIIIVTKTYEYK